MSFRVAPAHCCCDRLNYNTCNSLITALSCTHSRITGDDHQLADTRLQLKSSQETVATINTLVDYLKADIANKNAALEEMKKTHTDLQAHITRHRHDLKAAFMHTQALEAKLTETKNDLSATRTALLKADEDMQHATRKELDLRRRLQQCQEEYNRHSTTPPNTRPGNRHSMEQTRPRSVSSSSGGTMPPRPSAHTKQDSTMTWDKWEVMSQTDKFTFMNACRDTAKGRLPFNARFLRYFKTLRDDDSRYKDRAFTNAVTLIALEETAAGCTLGDVAMDDVLNVAVRTLTRGNAEVHWGTLKRGSAAQKAVYHAIQDANGVGATLGKRIRE